MTTLGFPDWNIGGLIPIGNNALDANGSLWWLDGEVLGWDSPEMRTTMLPRLGTDPTSDGEVAADLHYRGRTLQMNLKCASPSEAAREASRDLLARALDLTLSNSATATFFGNEVVPKQLSIQRAGNLGQGKLVMAGDGLSEQVTQTPGFRSLNGQVYLFSATVEMFATDPRKYAQTPQVLGFTGTGTTVTPTGNTATQKMVLSLAITGPPASIVITLGGRSMRLIVPTIPAGGPSLNPIPTAGLVIDIYNKTIKDAVAGTNYFYLRDLQTPWLVITPGAPQALSFTSTPAIAGGTLTFSDAWI